MSEVPPPNPEAEVTPPVAGVPDKNARMLAMLAHLLGIFTSVLGPLIIWLLKNEEDPYIDEQGKEAVNFQITMLIVYTISGALTMACIGFILLPLAGLWALVLGIIASMKTNQGEHYRYPLTIRLVQ
jgi:hypothetical protein